MCLFTIYAFLGKEKRLILWKMEISFSILPQTKKNTPKRELFSFFEIFTVEFSHFLWQKNIFCCDQKVTKLYSENFEKWKKFSPFWVFFSVWGRGGGIEKKISKCPFLKAPCWLFFLKLLILKACWKNIVHSENRCPTLKKKIKIFFQSRPAEKIKSRWLSAQKKINLEVTEISYRWGSRRVQKSAVWQFRSYSTPNFKEF